MLASRSSSSISLATVTPSLVTVGAPQLRSRTTFLPRGPRVTLTVLARTSRPWAMLCRADCENTICLEAMVGGISSGVLIAGPRHVDYSELRACTVGKADISSQHHGVAQLPPLALLLGRSQAGEHCSSEPGASPRPSHDQWSNSSPRGGP